MAKVWIFFTFNLKNIYTDYIPHVKPMPFGIGYKIPPVGKTVSGKAPVNPDNEIKKEDLS